jgi:predicted aspartyl protease
LAELSAGSVVTCGRAWPAQLIDTGAAGMVITETIQSAIDSATLKGDTHVEKQQAVNSKDVDAVVVETAKELC